MRLMRRSVSQSVGAGWAEAGEGQPTWYLHVAIVRAPAILCNSPIAQRVQGVLELPKRVSVEIKTCIDGVSRQSNGRSRDRLGRGTLTNQPLFAPWKPLHLPLVPCAPDRAWGARHCGVLRSCLTMGEWLAADGG